jgi:hypothetical protein
MAIDNNGNYGQENHNSQSESQAINSETMENKSPAINQHKDDSADNVNHEYSNHSLAKNQTEGESQGDDDINDFQKNAEIAQDLDDDLQDGNPFDSRNLDHEDHVYEDLDEKNKSDLKSKNLENQNDRNYADPYLEEEDIKPNIKEQGLLNPRK